MQKKLLPEESDDDEEAEEEVEASVWVYPHLLTLPSHALLTKETSTYFMLHAVISYKKLHPHDVIFGPLLPCRFT